MRRRELLKITSAAALGWPAWALAPGGKKQKILYFTRSAGFEHSVLKRTNGQLAHSERILTEIGPRGGFEVECTKDGRVFDGNLSQYDAFAFYTTGDLTAAAKDGSPPMTPEGKQKFLDAIRGGKGFIGFHSATDTFHSKGARDEIQSEVDPYIAMIGGEFVKHGAQQEASLFIASRLPMNGNLGIGEGISFTDEWYACKNYAKDLHVLLVQETRFMKGDVYQRPDYPATWARMHGKGRVFYTSLGHREDIWTNPFFQAIALGGIAWALGNLELDVKPNLDKVTPQANQLKI